MNKYILFFSALVLFVGCNGDNEGDVFKNPSSQETGISFENTLTVSEDLGILDYLYFYNGGGTAIGDINNDGLVDIYLSGNQVKNKLYLNKGNLQFEDITEQAGVAGNSTWNTGAVMGDVNGDGLLDIYVCAVVGINGFNGHNELFINNGDMTFTESAAKFGLDFDSYSSSAAFLDYDLDGDLDIYLLNHAVHTQESFGKADLRLKRNFQTGDKLLRNDGDRFKDVSEEAGIFGGINGYGLGVAISDFNQDGYPDIYVGNDFHEDDYYYLNNGNGTFRECLKSNFGHTSRFSMGNDVADINGDGWPDIISLDMLPEDEKVLKSSEGDENVQTQKMRIERFGYHYQFTRNMLFVNRPGQGFAETALLSGVAATDWSWSSLFGDYDQDGEQDLFISNGIPKRPNNLDFINFVSNEQIKKKINNTKLVDQQALDLMPSGKTRNYVFRGADNLLFSDESENWIANDTLASGATAWGDLDNDGDLDLLVNNINSQPSLYINKTNEKATYLKLKFQYLGKNKHGVGTKVFSYNQGKLQYKELFTVRGFQASSEPIVHFGYGTAKNVDSLLVVWPNGTYQTLTEVATNQTLIVQPKNTKSFEYSTLLPKLQKLFRKIDGGLGVDFVHKEDNYTDFNRQKLLPYQVSDRGPATSVGDLNNDGKDDIFFGGSKFNTSKIYLQTDSIFTSAKIPSIAKDSIKEDVTAVIADFDSNGKNDLIIGSGGADFYNKSKPLLNSYYVQKDSVFEQVSLPESYANASVIRPCDFDKDGDLDVFLGNQSISNDFGKSPISLLLENVNGTFTENAQGTIQDLGMVTDAIWDDFDEDGFIDLIVVGEWMEPTFFKNKNGKLTRVDLGIESLNGLWQSIHPFDVDGDGDTDYLLGNWGINTKFKASNKNPLKLYYGDIDDNGQTETVTAMERNGDYYPIDNLGMLASQMVFLKKRFNQNKDFAGKTMEEVFNKKELQKTTVLEVHQLKSGFLRNNGGKFTFVPFQNELQLAPLMAFVQYDFDADGKEEVLTAGNYFGVQPYHGRFDSFPGALIKSENNVILGDQIGLDLAHRSARHLNIISLNDKPYLLVTINNDQAQVYELKQ